MLSFLLFFLCVFFLYFALDATCSVEWNCFSNLVQGHERNISVKLF